MFILKLISCSVFPNCSPLQTHMFHSNRANTFLGTAGLNVHVPRMWVLMQIGDVLWFKKKSCLYAQQCCRELHLVRFTLLQPWIAFARQSLSAPWTASVSTHPDIKERLWCAALAISQPLIRVFSISARKEGQSTVISPMEMTSSRYRATSVLNSWTICVTKTWEKHTSLSYSQNDLVKYAPRKYNKTTFAWTVFHSVILLE